jgi:hypothetical protein
MNTRDQFLISLLTIILIVIVILIIVASIYISKSVNEIEKLTDDSRNYLSTEIVVTGTKNKFGSEAVIVTGISSQDVSVSIPGFWSIAFTLETGVCASLPPSFIVPYLNSIYNVRLVANNGYCVALFDAVTFWLSSTCALSVNGTFVDSSGSAVTVPSQFMPTSTAGVNITSVGVFNSSVTVSISSEGSFTMTSANIIGNLNVNESQTIPPFIGISIPSFVLTWPI